MAFGGDDWVMKLMGTEERASCSGLMFWKILINRSTHRSMPMIATPEGRNAWILGDGVGSKSILPYSPEPRKRTSGAKRRVQKYEMSPAYIFSSSCVPKY